MNCIIVTLFETILGLGCNKVIQMHFDLDLIFFENEWNITYFELLFKENGIYSIAHLKRELPWFVIVFGHHDGLHERRPHAQFVVEVEHL